MWGVPGSHVSGPNQFMRLRKNDEGELETYMDPPAEVAEKYDHSGAVPLEVGPGSIVLLHGSFLHYSAPNTSDK